MKNKKLLKQIKKFPLNIIKTKSKYKKAKKALCKILFDTDLKEYKYLLVLLIKNYENKKYKKLEDGVLFNKAIEGQKSGYLTKKQSEKKLDEWLNIQVKWSDEDQVFIAKSKNFPGLAAHGKTKQEAKKELLKCIEGVKQWPRKN